MNNGEEDRIGLTNSQTDEWVYSFFYFLIIMDVWINICISQLILWGLKMNSQINTLVPSKRLKTYNILVSNHKVLHHLSYHLEIHKDLKLMVR